MKPILIISLIILLISCRTKNREIETEKSVIPDLSLKMESINFRLDYNPKTAVLYKDLIVAIGKDSLGHNKMTVIDINECIVDSVIIDEFYDKYLANLRIKDDTLIGYFENRKEWKYWDNKWIDYNFEFENFFLCSLVI